MDALVELIDLAPTLLEAAGVPVPSAIQGHSLNSLPTGDTKEHRESVYTEFLDANPSYAIPPLLTSVRTTKYKLSLCDKPRSGELYRLEKGPGEFNNVSSDAHYKGTQEIMLELLVARTIEASDPSPERHTPC